MACPPVCREAEGWRGLQEGAWWAQGPGREKTAAGTHWAPGGGGGEAWEMVLASVVERLALSRPQRTLGVTQSGASSLPWLHRRTPGEL